MTFLGYGSSESLRIYEKGRASKKEGNSTNDEEKAKSSGTIYYADTKISLFGTKPVFCSFRGKSYGKGEVKSFKNLVEIVANNLYQLKPQTLIEMANSKSGISKKAKKPIISNTSNDLRTPLKIADEVYLEVNISSQTALDLICLLLDKCDVKMEDFYFSVTDER